MKFNTVTKCRLVGYGFFVAITILEIILFCNIFNIGLLISWGKVFGIIITTTIFNTALWWFAIRYQITKEHLERRENETSNQ